MPPGFENIEATLQLWLIAMIRPGAALFAAPMFGARNVPIQLRLVLALAVGISGVSASAMTFPVESLVSWFGFLIVVSEILVGLAIGFVLQIGFASALLAGEAISNVSGLSFAAMADPSTGTMSTTISQYLSMLTLILFLAMNGHLALMQIIAESYRALPPGQAWLSFSAIGGIVEFGGLMFSAGLIIALPVGFVLLLVQIIMGLVARSAPALNLFAVGLPATILAAVVLLAMATPAMADAISQVITQSLDQARLVAGG